MVSHLARIVRRLLPILLIVVGLTGCVSATSPLTLYVSPDGSDDAPEAGWSARKPYQTLPRATETVQQLVKDGRTKAGVVVTLLPGTYRLQSPLELGPQHSGKIGGKIVFRASKKGAATISGSVPLSEWKPSGDGLFTADLPPSAVSVPQVYANGDLLPLARYPNVDPRHPRSGGMLYVLGGTKSSPKTSLIYDREKLDPSRWQNATKGRIVIWPGANWNCDRRALTGIDPVDCILNFKAARYDIRRGNRFFVEGFFEELDAPGEWFANLSEKKLYLSPTQGSTTPEGITLPLSPGLIHLNGGSEEGISHITFEGIRFSECLGSAIVLENAHHCEIIGCEITRTEDAGIQLRNFSSHNRIEGCDIAWTGTEGIRLEGVRDAERTRTRALSYNTVENCHLHHIGTSRNAGGAIDLRPYCGGNIAHDNVFRNNLIHDTPRKGIMMGGVNNIAELNHIHHINLEQSDTGAIGLCTRDVKERGCIIRHNLIHDVGGYNMLEPGKWAFPSFCWAVYLDDWTSGVTVTGNILLDAPSGGVHVHSGLDNIIEHNIIRGNDKTLIQFSPIKPKIQYGQEVQMSGNIVRHNVALGSPGTPWLRGARDWISGVKECDNNLLWFDGAEPSCTVSRSGPNTWKDWQDLGFDRNSRITQPVFTPGTDWKLEPNSIATELGIEPIPVEKIGLRKNATRFSWPVQTEWVREDPILTSELAQIPSPRKREEIPAATAMITVDGMLASGEWESAAMLVLERDHRDEPAQPRSVAFVCYDRDALYIGIENVVNPSEAMKCGTSWGKDDAIEIALRKRPATPEAPIFVLRGFTDGSSYGSNAGGLTIPDARKAGNMCTYAAKVLAPLRWLAEVRIPWTAIPESGGSPCELQCNITCRKTADRLFLCWKPTGRLSYGVGEEGIIVPKQEN